MIFCKDCGQELDEQQNLHVEERNPCPSCGSISRLFTAKMSGITTSSGRLIAKKISTDGTEAISVSDSQKRSSATNLHLNGTLFHTIEGASPKGEADTLDVCNALIERLNMDGGNWLEARKPEGRESGVDAVVSNGQEDLYIQVTRAVSKQEIWQKLGQCGSVEAVITVRCAADDLLHSVNAKARRIPPDQSSKIVLALDAMDTASHALHAVVDDFRNRHGQAIRDFGFKAIWAVGPLAELTSRLDT